MRDATLYRDLKLRRLPKYFDVLVQKAINET
jgi:hypothetical protein